MTREDADDLPNHRLEPRSGTLSRTHDWGVTDFWSMNRIEFNSTVLTSMISRVSERY